MVIVRGLAAGINHRVDRRAAAEHAAPRLKTASTIELRLRNGLVARRIQPDRGGRGETQRRVNEHALVAPARLEKADADVGIFRQAPRQHAPARSGADDDVVELHRAPPVFSRYFLAPAVAGPIARKVRAFCSQSQSVCRQTGRATPNAPGFQGTRAAATIAAPAAPGRPPAFHERLRSASACLPPAHAPSSVEAMADSDRSLGG